MALLVSASVTPGWAAGAPPPLAVWAEVSANLLALSSREGVAAMLDRAKAAGVTAIVPEAKNAWGFVAYESAFVPHIRTSSVPRPWPPEYPAPSTWYPKDYDQLQVIIEEAHARGMQVHAAINVFGEGLTTDRVGQVFERPQWQVQYGADANGQFPASELSDVAFANPADPEVQSYELAVIAEVTSKYDVDGIVLDRARYPSIFADVSDLSRRQFERWLGQDIVHWPDDLFRVEEGQLVAGPFFRQWIAWRATIIMQFVRAAEHIVHTIKSQAAFAAYVGGWYPGYWDYGVNWAASSSNPPFPWVTPEWQGAAIADYLDYLMVGLYYPMLSRFDAWRHRYPEWMSVEGGALLASQVVGDTTAPVGSLQLSLYEGDPAAFKAALHTTRQLTRGVMLFDLVYLDRYGWWDLLKP